MYYFTKDAVNNGIFLAEDLNFTYGKVLTNKFYDEYAPTVKFDLKYSDILQRISEYIFTRDWAEYKTDDMYYTWSYGINGYTHMGMDNAIQIVAHNTSSTSEDHTVWLTIDVDDEEKEWFKEHLDAQFTQMFGKNCEGILADAQLSNNK